MSDYIPDLTERYPEGFNGDYDNRTDEDIAWDLFIRDYYENEEEDK